MRRFLLAAMVIVAGTTAQAQTTINFDGTNAPCNFFLSTPLTTEYAGHGVTFSGNGTILDQCSNFAVAAAHSGNQFLAYNSLGNFGLPGTMQFSSPQVFFSAWLAAASSYSLSFFIGATQVGALSNALVENVWTQVQFNGTYDRVVLNNVSTTLVVDDLMFAGPTLLGPEPSSVVLIGAGLLAVGMVARRRRSA